MNEILDSIIQQLTQLQNNLPLLLFFVGLLFSIHIINLLLGYRLNYLGIIPRNIIGLPGILFSPFLHGNFTHLLFNAIPLFVLSGFLLLEGEAHFYWLSLWIILVSGGLTWLLGRGAIHIGASSLITGYWGYLIIHAYEKPTTMTIIVALVSLYYFGGILGGILPSMKKNVSWEGHLFGMIAGVGLAFLY